MIWKILGVFLGFNLQNLRFLASVFTFVNLLLTLICSMSSFHIPSSCRSVQFLLMNHPVMFPEPSAELLMNISRSRRLIMLLSYAYLEQDWCSNNFRSGSHNADKAQVVLYQVLTVAWLQFTTRGQCCCDKLQRGHCLFSDRAFCTCWS